MHYLGFEFLLMNITLALEHSLPNSYTPAAPQLESACNLSSFTCHIPPLCYATNPPLSHPDFNAPGSNNSKTQVSLDFSQLKDNRQTQHSGNLSNNKLSSNDELLKTLLLLQPTPRQLLPCFHSHLSEPLPPLSTNPQPLTTMATRGIAAMPPA
jgi:hypothetical protein